MLEFTSKLKREDPNVGEKVDRTACTLMGAFEISSRKQEQHETQLLHDCSVKIQVYGSGWWDMLDAYKRFQQRYGRLPKQKESGIHDGVVNVPQHLRKWQGNQRTGKHKLNESQIVAL
jgi:hypothetical protein